MLFLYAVMFLPVDLMNSKMFLLLFLFSTTTFPAFGWPHPNFDTFLLLNLKWANIFKEIVKK